MKKTKTDKWEALLSGNPWLADELEDLTDSKGASVVSVVAIFTMMKVRIRQFLVGKLPGNATQEHHSDDQQPPTEAKYE